MITIKDDPDLFGIKLRDNPVWFLQLSKAEREALRKAEQILEEIRDRAGEDSYLSIEAGIAVAHISDILEPDRIEL